MNLKKKWIHQSIPSMGSHLVKNFIDIIQGSLKCKIKFMYIAISELNEMSNFTYLRLHTILA